MFVEPNVHGGTAVAHFLASQTDADARQAMIAEPQAGVEVRD